MSNKSAIASLNVSEKITSALSSFTLGAAVQTVSVEPESLSARLLAIARISTPQAISLPTAASRFDAACEAARGANASAVLEVELKRVQLYAQVEDLRVEAGNGAACSARLLQASQQCRECVAV
jgi:hypothetical protein